MDILHRGLKHPTPATVVVEKDGERHTGSYTVDGGVMTVSYQGRHTQPILLGASPSATLAKVLLSELLSEDVN